MDVLTRPVAIVCLTFASIALKMLDTFDNEITTYKGSIKIHGMFDADFAHDSTWIGAGYDF